MRAALEPLEVHKIFPLRSPVLVADFLFKIQRGTVPVPAACEQVAVGPAEVQRLRLEARHAEPPDAISRARRDAAVRRGPAVEDEGEVVVRV